MFYFLDQIIKEVWKLFSPERIKLRQRFAEEEENSGRFLNLILISVWKFHWLVWTFNSWGQVLPKLNSTERYIWYLTFIQNIFTSKLFLFHLNETDATILQCAIHQVSIITLQNFTHFFRLYFGSFHFELLLAAVRWSC